MTSAPSATSPVRWLGLALLVYAPHLLEEHLEGMHDDPMIVWAFDALMGDLSARAASYATFQAMMLAGLTTTWLFARGGPTQRAVLMGIALGLLAEAHHAVRALASFELNAGLLTSLPMPILGAVMLRAVWRSASVSPLPLSAAARTLP